MDLGQSIRKVRKGKGFTQVEFSTLIGITQSYLSLIEKGEKTPSMEVIRKMAIALKTPVPILFWFTLDEEDVPEHKREAFRILRPSVDSLVNAFFDKSP